MHKPKKWVVNKRQADDLLDHLLLSRGITDKQDFLHPQFSHRHDPGGLPNILKAVDTIVEAVQSQKPIAIYGDYDCDGIPGTALLWHGLTAVGAKLYVYIPRRENGYGLSNEGIDSVAGSGACVLITVDNGTTALEHIAYANTKGLSVIVTDHHEPHLDLPAALILNPKLPGSAYPFRELCGTGVAYKLLEALAKRFPGQLTEGWLKWHLDLVALATICDMVALTGENRVLTTFGLMVLRKSHNVGLQSLLKVAGLQPDLVTAGTVGFSLGPRINAAGRTESDPMLGFRLLTTDSITEADRIAQELHQLNEHRQQLVRTAVEQAELQLQDQRQMSQAAIVLQHPNWSPGIIGLIAAKLLERYHKPVFIFEGETGKGSARSIHDYPLPPVMEHLQDHCISYGGHALAGGMVLKPGQFELFRKEVHDVTRTQLGEEERVPHLHLDAEIGLDQIDSELANTIDQLEPFGVGNPRPLFILRAVVPEQVKVIGNGQKHLRGSLTEGRLKVQFVAFGQADRIAEMQRGRPINVAARVEKNTWNGRITTELHVVDIEASL